MSERSDADYAIEFGEYMAKGVDCLWDVLSRPIDLDELADVANRLRASAYEFRKRARRVPTAWLGAAQAAKRTQSRS